MTYPSHLVSVEHEVLEREIGRLRTLYQQQQPRQSTSTLRRTNSKDLDSQFANLSLKHKDASSGADTDVSISTILILEIVKVGSLLKVFAGGVASPLKISEFYDFDKFTASSSSILLLLNFFFPKHQFDKRANSTSNQFMQFGGMMLPSLPFGFVGNKLPLPPIPSCISMGLGHPPTQQSQATISQQQEPPVSSGSGYYMPPQSMGIYGQNQQATTLSLVHSRAFFWLGCFGSISWLWGSDFVSLDIEDVNLFQLILLLYKLEAEMEETELYKFPLIPTLKAENCWEAKGAFNYKTLVRNTND
ncbi:hypothetical protein V2J09_000433 [Rumex salicifolius]